jgi:membrane protein DedA with SNARE-associated domain
MFFVHTYPHLFYLAAFAAMFIEGDLALLLFGVLAKGHYARFSFLFVVACLATLVHDYLFWKIGSRLAKYNKHKYLYFDLGKFTRSMERFKPYTGPIVFLSKFIWNFNRIILVSVGYLGIPYRKIFKFSLGAAVVWPLAYMSIGYVFADKIDIFRQRIETAAIALAVVIGLVVLFELYVRKFVMRAFFSNGDGDVGTDKKEE